MNTPVEPRTAPKTFTFDGWHPGIEREDSYRKRTFQDFAEFVNELIEAAGGSAAPDPILNPEEFGKQLRELADKYDR